MAQNQHLLGVPERITQIKGKGNAAPKAEYLPFVQDFVRSGQWSDVGDLSNADMFRLPDNRFVTRKRFEEVIGKLSGKVKSAIDAEWFNNQINKYPSWWNEVKAAFDQPTPAPAKSQGVDYNFPLKIQTVKNPIDVYHTTDAKNPMISTLEDRLIPNSISTSTNGPNYVWGENAFRMQIPAGARVSKLKSVFDLLPKGAEASPKEIGRAIEAYAKEHNLDAVFIKQVPGTAGEGEWAIFNPEYLKGAVPFKSYASGGIVTFVKDPDAMRYELMMRK
jgi:hypothetical protein